MYSQHRPHVCAQYPCGVLDPVTVMKLELHLPHPFCCAQVPPPGAISLQELPEGDEDEPDEGDEGDEGGPSYAET